MKTLDSEAVIKDLLNRLQTLRPETAGLWGKMDAHQMVCHLTDSFGLAMSVKLASENVTFLNRTFVRWVALHTSLPWPKGVPTRPEMDQMDGGTRPIEFGLDMAALTCVIQEFACKPRSYSPSPAPVRPVARQPFRAGQGSFI